MSPSLRFQQRFEHFQRAYLNLEEVVNMGRDDFSNLEKEGIIQRFEVLIELCWKVIKDFLESEGFTPKSPKECIRQAYTYGLISNPEEWLQALERRNITSHTYDSKLLDENVEYILSSFSHLAQNLYLSLKAKL